MYPHHDRETRFAVLVGGTGDVQVETLELILQETLSRKICFWEAKELFFDGPLASLRADWTVSSAIDYWRVSGTQFRLTESRRDRGIFDPAKLEYWRVRGGDRVFNALECGLESNMTEKDMGGLGYHDDERAATGDRMATGRERDEV